jgi:leucine-rich repeat protein SHOC2
MEKYSRPTFNYCRITDEKLNEYDKTVKSLNLSYGYIEYMPISLSVHFKFLVELDLQNNNLKVLNFKSKILLRLHLGRNDFKEFPVYKDQLPALEELYLDGNNIKKLPDVATIMPNLKILDMRYNNLQHIVQPPSSVLFINA